MSGHWASGRLIPIQRQLAQAFEVSSGATGACGRPVAQALSPRPAQSASQRTCFRMVMGLLMNAVNSDSWSMKGFRLRNVVSDRQEAAGAGSGLEQAEALPVLSGSPLPPREL